MKTGKTFTLDLELVNQLNNEENASEIVNKLIQKHYADKGLREKTLDEKLQEVKELEDELIAEKEKKRKEVSEEIERLKKVEREMIKRQQEELEKNITLIESNPILSKQFINIIKKKPTLLDNKIELIDWVEKFRNAGIKIGIFQLKKYAEVKLKSK